jgi:hypothetical protein
MSCSCGSNHCIAEHFFLESYGHCNVLEVHTDQSLTDVKTCVSLDKLNGNGIFKIFVNRCGKAAARIGLWNNVYNFKAFT